MRVCWICFRLSLNHPSHGRCRGCKANLVVKFCAKAVPNDPAATDSSAAKEDATASTSHARSFSVLRQEAVDVVADVDAPAKKTSTVLLLSDESRGLCQVCRVPNDLLTAAQRSRCDTSTPALKSLHHDWVHLLSPG